jgi:hypothetical protein
MDHVVLKIQDRNPEIVLALRTHLDGPNIGFNSDESSKVCCVVLCWVERGAVTYILEGPLAHYHVYYR